MKVQPHSCNYFIDHIPLKLYLQCVVRINDGDIVENKRHCETNIYDRRNEAKKDDKNCVLQPNKDDFINKLVEDDETLNEKEAEGCENEELFDADSDVAICDEETIDGDADEHTEEADLEADLSNIVRVEATERKK